MVEKTTRHLSARGPYRAAVVLSVAALAMPLGPAETAVGAPERAATPTPATGGIDGEALRYRMLNESSATGAAELRGSDGARRVQERESGTAAQDVRARTAQRLPTPRTVRGWQLRVDGSLRTKPITPVPVAANVEDDGAIPLARDLGLGARRAGIATTGTIGDGPYGSAGAQSGDYDFYRVDASRGDTLSVDVDRAESFTPSVLLYDADGTLIVGAEITTLDGPVHLSHPIEERGTYYIAVGSSAPEDPFDPASGTGVGTEGTYGLEVSRYPRGTADTDVYAVPLRRGDVLGATVTGSARRVAVHELDGDLVQAAASDVGLSYPGESPLPRGGNATANHVVARTGLYLVSVADGTGDYTLVIGSHRTRAAQGARPQTVLLDFTGPSFDNRVFGAVVLDPGIRDITPMRDFLPRWGLPTSAERAVIRATTARVRQTLRRDIPGSRIRVTNTLRDPDLFGGPGVSRVLVGGTVAEAGLVSALGWSESIDPGNFAREETAIVMLDRMSGDDPLASLNQFLTEDSDRVRAVAQALGNTAAHEVGHFLGNHHTDDLIDPTSTMNTGNRLHFYAVGPDGVAGTRDDDRIGMRRERYDRRQFLTGIEDTIYRTAVALR